MNGKQEKKIRKEIRAGLKREEFKEVWRQTWKANAFKKIFIILLAINAIMIVSNVIIITLMLTD